LTSPPTKIFDYLATGKPIVSTALPALEDFRDCVRLAASPDEFVRLLKEALVENDAALREKRKQRARENSWAARAEEIMSVIERISSGEAR
jgi:glycosyltransferase involved in cell wall biosynthesis